ncbi:hypothetical protein [Roseovarius phycicola]|uniref:Metallo-beta-lactamase domain-containing protein n=1 Tax=Roseovarius phycicola TaxID=3080976 RepID=A0ABZ2HI08_9RHOB
MAEAPESDELEISLFGPAFGEALVIHYGEGKWICIDSCIDESSGRPATLVYLEGIGVSLETQVSHLVLTHTDGDHVRGISTLFAACEQAQLILPAALDDRHAAAYLASNCEPENPRLSVGTKEIVAMLRMHGERKKAKPIHFAIQDRAIFDEDDIKLTALAPDDVSIRKYLDSITSHIPDVGTIERPPPSLKPNHSSTVLLLETHNGSYLFGADLEETPSAGWTRVLQNSISFRAANNFRVYKVAHHGSKGSHCELLWKTLNNPTSILAPFVHGRHSIPNRDEAKLIIDQSARSFSTSSIRTKKKKRASSVDRKLRLHGIRRSSAFPSGGQIRYRLSATGVDQVDLFGAAVPLSRIS